MGRAVSGMALSAEVPGSRGDWQRQGSDVLGCETDGAIGGLKLAPDDQATGAADGAALPGQKPR